MMRAFIIEKLGNRFAFCYYPLVKESRRKRKPDEEFQTDDRVWMKNFKLTIECG